MDSQITSGESGQGNEASPSWLETIPEGLKVETQGEGGESVEIALRDHPKVKEFEGKGIEALITDYLNAQKLIGKKAGLRAPAEDASDEDKAAFDTELRQMLGVPENPEGYEITLPEGTARDEAMSAWFAQTAHKLGMPPGMAQGLSDAFQEFGKSYWDGKLEADLEASKAAMVKDYGDEAKAAEASEFAKTAFQAVAGAAGVKAEEAEMFMLAHGNDPTVVRLFGYIGNSFKEHGLPGGGNPPGGGDEAMSGEDFYKKQVFGGK